MKNITKIGIIIVIAFTISMTSNVFAAPPPSLMEQIQLELEEVQNTILNAISTLSNDLATTLSSISSQLDDVEGNTETIIIEVNQNEVDIEQALSDIDLARQEISELDTQIAALSLSINEVQTSLGSLISSVEGLGTQMTTEHNAILDAINGITVTSSSISEETGVFYTSETDKDVTLTKVFTEPTRVSLWIYGSDGDEWWEGYVPGEKMDAFSWKIRVNRSPYMASSAIYIDTTTPYKHPSMQYYMRDTGGDASTFIAYKKLAWLLVDDIPIVGEISVTITQTLDRPNSDGTPYNDPISYQWLIG